MISRRAFLIGAVLLVLVSFPISIHAQTAAVTPATPTSPVILLKTLSLGSTGSDVYALQQFLHGHGYFTYAASTGFFGPVTKAAVIAFQRDNGIDPIGVVGPLTRARIAFLSNPPLTVADTFVVAANTPVATSTPRKKYYGSGVRTSVLHTVGGTVSGLSGTGLVLQNNGGDDLALAENGTFTFHTLINTGGAYNVSVLTNPLSPSQECVVSNGSGTMQSANVSDISITCTTDTYTITSSGDGNESITPSTPQIVDDSSTLSLTVTANSGYALSDTVGGTCRAGSWSGSTYTTGAITGSCTISFSAAPNTYSLTIAKSGNGTGSVISFPAGISCGSTCTASYSSGTVVNLTPVADGGSDFAGWSGGGCSGGGFCSVTMDAIKSVTAMFITLLES